MTWKDTEIEINEGMSIAHIMKCMDACKNKEEAKQFMEEYTKVNEYAKENIGYIAGYYSKDDMKRIWDWFDCSHPIFGTNANLSPEEILKMGIEAGQKAAANV